MSTVRRTGTDVVVRGGALLLLAALVGVFARAGLLAMQGESAASELPAAWTMALGFLLTVLAFGLILLVTVRVVAPVTVKLGGSVYRAYARVRPKSSFGRALVLAGWLLVGLGAAYLAAGGIIG